MLSRFKEIQRSKKRIRREIEDKLYEEISKEFIEQRFDQIAYVRALEEAEGDEAKTQAAYIRQRMIQMQNELDAAGISRVREEKQRMKELEIQHQLVERNQKHAFYVQHREQIDEAINAGVEPSRAVQRVFYSEFKAFYKKWKKADFARRYLPISSAWTEFFRGKNF
ncbi:hypothetical protein [Celeribacter halophilus]|uniref:hypothetical protein n=1 Tax=Celeribacter halophilus TaxID=576117 RepID=UPI001C09430C|nr:hypothetical protein [Celeribacter halophilus]MBU2889921.1 hypothetical protein [Celeribacter halophilus]MDO6509259.1 hypothetical protein [Celeribacter halophilus]